MVGVDAFLKQVLRGAIVVAAVAAYSFRATGLWHDCRAEPDAGGPVASR